MSRNHNTAIGDGDTPRYVTRGAKQSTFLRNATQSAGTRSNRQNFRYFASVGWSKEVLKNADLSKRKPPLGSRDSNAPRSAASDNLHRGANAPRIHEKVKALEENNKRDAQRVFRVAFVRESGASCTTLKR